MKEIKILKSGVRSGFIIIIFHTLKLFFMKLLNLQLIIFSLFFLCSSEKLFSQCNCAPPYIIPPGSSTLNVFAGETYCLNTGVYTGNINVYAGGKICISGSATFNPGSINNFEGTIENYGTLTINTNFSFSSGALIDNYGVFNLNSNLNFIDSGTITNQFGGKLFLNKTLDLTNNSTFNNYGTVISKGEGHNFIIDVTSNLNNYGNLRIQDGNFTSDGTVLNEGMIYAGKQIDIKSGNVINNCRIVSVKGFSFKSGTFENNGLIWAAGTNGNEAQVHFFADAQFTNGINGHVRGVRFTNAGIVNGYGEFYFTEQTKQQGSFIGTAVGNPIRFFDVSQTGSKIMDVELPAPVNTIRPNNMIPLDTLVLGNICPGLLLNELPLPIKLNYFNGECNDGEIKLTWLASEEENITGYNVEGSVDGKDFEEVGYLNSRGKDYNYTYSTTNTAYKYFRLAVQEKGFESYSKLISINCLVKVQSIQDATVNPNPNNGLFTIDFVTEITGEIELKVLNAQSKVVYTNNFEINTGNNSIVVELNNVPPGFYISTIRDQQGTTRHMRFVVN